MNTNLDISYDINKIEADYCGEAVIHELFHQQVNLQPDAAAVIFNDLCLSYSEFNSTANRLANYLLKQLKQRDNYIIGVLLDRSVEMLAAIFAILKAGCAYLPLNPDEPAERLQFMLNDSGTSTLITHGKFKEKINFHGTVIYVDEGRWQGEDKENPCVVYRQTDLAYVIYTSGTTGHPKGVMTEHRALLNRILWMQKQFPIAEGDIILHKTPYTFDVSVWELLWWSITGAGVSVLNPGEHKDVMAMTGNIVKNKVTVMHFVPPMLNIFLDYVGADTAAGLKEIGRLKYVFSSGEALKPHQVNKFNSLIYKKNGTRLINLYGPTEAAIDVTYFDCTGEKPLDKVPIGKPIDNIQIYIVDENNGLCGTGKAGELCISGVGLARGYLNRPELNDGKFVPLPWDSTKRMYRTGDLAVQRQDGNIEFLGRIDHQVKIRGNRVELGEIEAVLVKDEEVKEAAVLAVEGKNDDKFLCAFIVPQGEFSSVQVIKQRLEQKLPEYMIPHRILVIRELPLSINGKLDREELLSELDRQNEASSTADDMGDDPIWPRLINIIKDKVNLKIPTDKITHEDSLEDVGIDSLSFLRIIIEIESEFGFEFNMEDLNALNFNTMRCVANYIEENIKNGMV